MEDEQNVELETETQPEETVTPEETTETTEETIETHAVGRRSIASYE